MTDNEFTDIITESSLIPNNPSNSSEFKTITTKTILVSSSSSESSTSAFEFESPEELIKAYDGLFSEPDEYIRFINQKLIPWKNTIEFQHFDLHYTRHRADMHNIRTKRAMAQKLLEEADRMQKDHDHTQKRFHYFISTINRQNLKRRLYKPIKIDHPPVHTRLEQRARRLPDPPTQLPAETTLSQRLDQKLKITTPEQIRTMKYNHYKRFETPRYKCFKCQSYEHLLYHCPQYRCYHCRRLAPGHRARECPQLPPQPFDEEEIGYADPPAFEDGNLNGEN